MDITPTTSTDRAKREKLFIVAYVDNATQDRTPLSPKPLAYEPAMQIKAEAEAAGKHDLKRGFFAAFKLTDAEYDRYEAKLKAGSQASAPAAQPAKSGKPSAPAAQPESAN